MGSILAQAARFLPLLLTLALVAAALALANAVVSRRWRDNSDARFRLQLIMLALILAGGLAVIIALPVSDTLRGQLLSLVGIVLSAAIALSSTTFIGNIMAGMMLRIIKSARPGDFVTVVDISGRVTTIGLLHTEVQTEDRDLVTIPNLYLVTQPIKVVRATGTIVWAEVSLGYDIPRVKVSELLREAATSAGLSDAFVLVRDLGDFAVLYRVAGLLEEVTSLISARSRLREAMLDVLHGAGIEIVSPTFMNTRAISDKALFIPEPTRSEKAPEAATAEEVAFDKADEAASVEEIRKAIEAVEAELATLDEDGKVGGDPKEKRTELETRKQGLVDELSAAEAHQEASDQAERTSSAK